MSVFVFSSDYFRWFWLVPSVWWFSSDYCCDFGWLSSDPVMILVACVWCSFVWSLFADLTVLLTCLSERDLDSETFFNWVWFWFGCLFPSVVSYWVHCLHCWTLDLYFSLCILQKLHGFFDLNSNTQSYLHSLKKSLCYSMWNCGFCI